SCQESRSCTTLGFRDSLLANFSLAFILLASFCSTLPIFPLAGKFLNLLAHGFWRLPTDELSYIKISDPAVCAQLREFFEDPGIDRSEFGYYKEVNKG